MITHISIKNFATIENVDVDLHDGLNIITGETGSGKSIVIQAISLALGSRADTGLIRAGCHKALVQMIFEHLGKEYIITREISDSGKNICRVNDEIVTVGRLSSLCEKLADIHGQYDHQSLLDPENHIKLVDLYRRDDISRASGHVASLYEQYSRVCRELSRLESEAARDSRERDFMAYELNELDSAQLVSGEDAALEEQIALLQNSEKIYEDLAEAYQISSGSEPSVLSSLKRMSQLLSEISSYSQELADLFSRTDSLYYDLEDICSTLRDCRDRAVFSPEELDSLISRLETINRLRSKHGKTVDQLIEYRDELARRLANIENADDIKLQLEKEKSDLEDSLSQACDALSHERKTSAGSLEEKISRELSQLSFSDARFAIEFKRSDTFSPSGNDIVEFLISTNKGEPLKPLSRIASGGEMSRIMLAFKKIIGDYDDIPTMIFDEIDSGISGIAASVVGRKLHEIAENHQIICITHLPQIAAFGAHNYRISKSSDSSMTYTVIEPLSDEEKVMEIARLLGGANITETTMRSARELIEASV